jgi:hypothetical protein
MSVMTEVTGSYKTLVPLNTTTLLHVTEKAISVTGTL